MIQIIPSIASANMLCLGEEIKKIETYGYMHLDIEDGNFSPYITFGTELIEKIAAVTDMELDAHLMVTNPLDYIEPLVESGVTSIAFHLEAARYPFQCIERIHALGAKAGVALNYKTRAEELEPYLEVMDYILLQTGETGDPDLAFRPYTYDKVKWIRNTLQSIPIWVDGGVTKEMLPRLEKAGVSAAIMGRSIFQRGE